MTHEALQQITSFFSDITPEELDSGTAVIIFGYNPFLPAERATLTTDSIDDAAADAAFEARKEDVRPKLVRLQGRLEELGIPCNMDETGTSLVVDLNESAPDLLINMVRRFPFALEGIYYDLAFRSESPQPMPGNTA